MMLTDKISIEHLARNFEPEDFFACAIHTLFPHDTRTLHGDPGSLVVYKSKNHGNIKLRVVNPDRDDDRKLFAHYLWNASVYIADKIESEDEAWNVKHESVLELGTGQLLELPEIFMASLTGGRIGLGLCGIITALEGADNVTLTDYPAPELLSNIIHNIESQHLEFGCSLLVAGYVWGSAVSTLRAVDGKNSESKVESNAQNHSNAYTRIICADCLWMPWEHANLASSMSKFLSVTDSGARIWVVAGFHTGRDRVANFFAASHSDEHGSGPGYGVLASVGLEVEKIWEEDVDGHVREWYVDREHEDILERKRWMVIAVLRRRGC